MKTFKQYFLTEGKQKGFEYEKNAARELKKYDVVPANFTPAGSGSSKPDLMIQKPGGKPAGCELKITNITAGSLVIHREDGIWKLGDTFKIIEGEEVPQEEKVVVEKMAKKHKIMKKINETWTAKSKKFDVKSKLSNQEQYERDHATFKELKGTIDATTVTSYYNAKNTYYFNVGTHGLFLLGGTNPLKLKGLTKFADSARCWYRARVQKKSSAYYQFVLELYFSILRGSKSSYNIAPLPNAKTVKIDTRSDIFHDTLRDLFGVEKK